MRNKVNLWLRRLVIRQAIRIVDAIESQCFTWQTALRAKLAPEMAEPPASVSDFCLAWRVTKVLFLLLGILVFVSFFATLHAFYFLCFTLLTLSGWMAVFAVARKIKFATAPASGRRRAPASDTSPVAGAGESLAESAFVPARAQTPPTPPPGSVVCASAARRESFTDWEARRAGVRPEPKPRRRRGISSAEFNRRVVGQMEEIFNQ
jgi:hypothetical protein